MGVTHALHLRGVEEGALCPTQGRQGTRGGAADGRGGGAGAAVTRRQRLQGRGVVQRQSAWRVLRVCRTREVSK